MSVMGENLNRMLQRLEMIKKLPFTEKGVHLHLGCGPHIFEGFINSDKYYEDDRVLKCDMYKVPFTEETVDTIYSSHALEHLPIRFANAAIENWYKVLRKEGRLFLAIPDLEEIMRIMLDPSVDENAKWKWYIHTLFGYQIKPGEINVDNDIETPVDLGQFHTTGFTKKRIQYILERTGFIVTEIYSYDGWGTPSIWIEAKKQ